MNTEDRYLRLAMAAKDEIVFGNLLLVVDRDVQGSLPSEARTYRFCWTEGAEYFIAEALRDSDERAKVPEDPIPSLRLQVRAWRFLSIVLGTILLGIGLGLLLFGLRT